MPRLTFKSDIRKSSGFTLIEILITIVVVSIGLLGLAGLQISGLRANMGSEIRSKATLLANDMAERMRANPLAVHNRTAAVDNQYADITMAANDCGVQPAAICSNYNDGTANDAADCSPAEMATFDAWVWACGMPVNNNVVPGGLTNILLGGTGSVQCNDIDGGVDADACSAGSSHTITITWDAPNPDFSGNENVPSMLSQSYSLVMVP
jgi:type IV pilus assembly protein PilV